MCAGVEVAILGSVDILLPFNAERLLNKSRSEPFKKPKAF
jgi:hypothetical protein